MALLFSKAGPLWSSAKDFYLLGTDDKLYSLESFIDKKVLVIVFMCNHCPYVKAVLQRLIDLQNEFIDQDVQFIGINSNDTIKYPEDSMENMKKIMKEKQISFPYLLDKTQQVAVSYGAVCTPDIFVYGPDRTLLYQGRVDDNWQYSEKVSRQDLKEAIQLILNGEEVFEKQTPSMGCSIKWKTE